MAYIEKIKEDDLDYVGLNKNTKEKVYKDFKCQKCGGTNWWRYSKLEYNVKICLHCGAKHYPVNPKKEK